MFLNDGKVVFSLFIILIKFSRFIFCSYDSVCSGSFGCVAFPFSEVGGSFWLGCFCLLIFDKSGTVLLPCWLFIFWCISSISSSENQLFFITILTWSASPWLVWKLEYSCQISIILFLYSLCEGLLLKLQNSVSWFVMSSPCFVFASLMGVVP